MTRKPTYQHDCDACEFIQNLTVDDTEYDVYRCSGGRDASDVSWIARFGDDGPLYWSMPWDILKTANTEQTTPIMQAVQRIAKEYA